MSAVRTRLNDFLQREMQEKGLEYVHVSWNDEWLNKLKAMPEGSEKEIEMDKGLLHVLESFEAVERGEYTLLTAEEIREKIDGPWDEDVSNVVMGE